jgi:hypothetical protein
VRIVTNLIAMNRGLRLRRQLAEIEKQMRALPQRIYAQLALLTRRELDQAGESDFPHLYGTPREMRYSPYGQGNEIGLARARSDSPQIAIRGIALWLAVVYHETRDSPHANMQELHRQTLRVLRLMKEMCAGQRDVIDSWMHSEAAA